VRGVARDAVASVARHLATVVAGVVTVPILARALGAPRLGLWSLVGTTAYLLMLCDLGLSSATLRAAAGRDAAYAKKVARLAALCSACVSLPAAAGCAAWLLHAAARLPAEQQGDARAAVVVALAAGVLASATQPFRSYAQGQGRIVRLAWARVAGAVLQLALTILLLALGLRLRAVAIGFAAGAAVEATLGLRAAADEVRSRGLPGRAERSELVRVAGSALAVNASVAVAMRVDLVILERVTDLATIGAYSVAQRIVDQAYTLVAQVEGALVPRLGLRGGNRSATVFFGTMTVGALNAAPLAALAVAGRDLVVSFAGPAVDQPILGVALACFAASATIASSETVASSAMSLSGDALVAARWMATGAAVNLVLSLAGARLLGPWAVAAATTAGNLVVAVGVWRAARAMLGWTASDVVRALAPLGSAAATGALVALGLQSLGFASAVCTVAGALAGLGPAALQIWRAANRTPACAEAS
jgi:O-antigen/teichoic acid export membrane protein